MVSPARRLLRYLIRYRLRYGAGAVCLAFATLFSLGIPWMVKGAVDVLASGRGTERLWWYVLAILALAAAHGIARMGSRFTIIGAGQWVEHDLRRDLFAHLTRLGPAFYQSHRTGDLVSRGSSDASTVRMLAGFGSAMMIQTSLAFAGTLLAMWAIDPWLTLYALSPFPLLILITRRSSHAVDAQSAAVQQALGALSAKLQENLAGMTVVRAYTMEAHEVRAFERLNGAHLARSLALARTQAVSWPLLGAVGGLGTLLVLWLGGKAVVEGRITLGALVAFNGYLAHLAWPTIALGWTLASVRRGLASMRRIAEILDVEPVVDAGRDHAAGFAAADMPAPDLEFRHLTFAYGERGPVLHDVSFRVPAGGVVAVVGPTGSGKTTLGLLVCRLEEPPRGSVLVGGEDVRDLSLATLRRTVGYVPQEPFLFSRALRENLLFGDAEAGEARMVAAARTAGLEAEVGTLPARWDTVVGERGLTLSGGQRQRVALARALLAEPRVLVLDDPFASVDPGKEAEILEAIRHALRGRTVLLMTHRLLAAREADWVVSLADGVVVEQGTHDDLLLAGGLYASLWRVQQLEEDLARD